MLTADDAKFLREIRTRLDRLKPGTRLLLCRYDQCRLTGIARTKWVGTAPYQSFSPKKVRKWLDFADAELVSQVASTLTRSL